MSENEHRGIRDLSQYDSMPTEALEQILRADAETPAEQESDIELILYIMEVLSRRKKENQQSEKAAQQSWESFQQHYLPEQKIQKQNTTKPSGRPWLRRIAACAAAVILIFCIPLSSRALSLEELWDVVARWAKETFSFVSRDAEQVSEPEATDAIGYTSLQDLLKRNKVDSKMVPTWIPDGFSLKQVEKVMSPGREVYIAFYQNSEKELTIRIQTYMQENSLKFEVEEGSAEIYEYLDMKYYIFSNMDQLQIIWLENHYECVISGNISINDAKSMINSIQRGVS